MPRPYPRKSRDDVIAVARRRDGGVTLAQVARDFGVSESYLTNWLKAADAEDGANPTVTYSCISPLPVTSALWWPEDAVLRDLATNDGLWRAYCAATVRFDLPSGTVHLTPQPSPGPGEPPVGDLHVITACDPANSGRRGDDAARMELLRAELDGLTCYPAEGGDLDAQHDPEPSIAVQGLTDRQAQELGRRFGQVAVFSWSGWKWSVLACATHRRSDLGWELSPG